MNELSAFERRLAAGLEAYASPRQRVDADAIARAAANRLPLRRSILLRFMAVVAPAPRLAWGPTAVVALVAFLALALAAGVVIVGNQQRRLPAVVEPASNGLIAYAHAGDIFVGDPMTGATTAIVSGPEIDSGPIFSPAGTRIAFIRGDPMTKEASLVVVRVDGTDQRVVMPPGYSQRGAIFAWTPGGGSLLVNHDSAPLTTPYFDGELSLFDASGVAEPRLLTPPLPKWPATSYFDPNDQVAAMFRPPTGDRILSYGYDTVTEHDVDGTALRQLMGPDRTDVRFASIGSPAWSPDASKIAFAGQLIDGREEHHIYVMNADGSDLRRLDREGGGSAAWSPDGSRIAYEVASTPVGDCPEQPWHSVIAITDMESGVERVLEATSADCGSAGWSWAPDGRSIVRLERSGTRPYVVDVETGRATELPWVADSPPSWQHVALGDSR